GWARRRPRRRVHSSPSQLIRSHRCSAVGWRRKSVRGRKRRSTRARAGSVLFGVDLYALDPLAQIGDDATGVGDAGEEAVLGDDPDPAVVDRALMPAVGAADTAAPLAVG